MQSLLKSMVVFVCVGLSNTLLSPSAFAQATPDFAAMSLEELMDVPVYSVSKRSQPISEAPAAITVISEEDIRRSSAQSIPELLRMVPGLVVSQINRSTWSISSRGFRGRFADKLLVLIDGRSIYDPVFSGVYWNIEDVMLQDIERIEVIRGPGGTMWGANAVNGVINILTKKAKDTKGGLLFGSSGTGQSLATGARVGTSLGEHGALKLYGKYSDLDHTDAREAGDAFDETETVRTGFRAEWEDKETAITLKGDLYSGNEHDQYLLPSVTQFGIENTATRNYSSYSGGNIQGSISHTLSAESQVTGTFYYSRTNRDDGLLDASNDTFNIELQHHLKYGDQHQIVWGVGSRTIWDDLGGPNIVRFDPERKNHQLLSFFAQDEFSFTPELRMSAGAKLEHNDYTGFEVQPSARLLWEISKSQSIWTAYSRAVHTPDRLARDVFTNIFATEVAPGQSAEVRILSNDEVDSEVLNAYEVGYRVSPMSKVHFDIAAFIFDYNSLTSLDPGQPSIDFESQIPHLVLPFTYANTTSALTSGVELSTNVELQSWWRVVAAYWYYDADFDFGQDDLDFAHQSLTDSSPHNQYLLQSTILFPSDIEFSSMLRFVDDFVVDQVPSYYELDARLSWRPLPGLELACIGRNLLHSNHLEDSSTIGTPIATEIPRSVIGQITWHF